MKNLLFLLLLTITLHARNGDLAPITLQLQWKHQFEFAGFYAAKERGYYREVGLDVEFLEHNSSESIVDEVLQNRAQYGVGYSSVIADFYNAKPIVMLANFFKHSPLVLVAQESITSPVELKGGVIMGSSDTIDNMVLFNMLGKFGLSYTDYKTIPTDFKIEKFISKEIDAMSVFSTNEIYELDRVGVKYTLFNPALYTQEYYDCNLFTTIEEVREHPNRARDFTQASIKGWEYALAHKEELVEIILKKYNTQHKRREALLFEAEQVERIMLKDIYPIGMIDKRRVEAIADELKQSGFIDKGSFRDVDKFIFLQNGELFTLYSLQNYMRYINTELIWQLIAILTLLLMLILWRNYIVKKLNRKLQEEVARAIKETKSKDNILFHQSKLISMGEMMQNIAHQWRQPLSQINSAVFVIDDALSSEDIKNSIVDEKLLEIEKLTAYMSKTITDFREFYSPDKKEEYFEFHKLIEEAIDIVEGSFKENSIAIHFDYSLECSYISYANELKQALVILLNNAKEALLQRATPNPQVTLSLALSKQSYSIEVADNAGGVAEDIRDKIFEPYFTTKYKSQGRGLGLYIAKLIVEDSLMGSLTLKNSQEGACFCIYLKEKYE